MGGASLLGQISEMGVAWMPALLDTAAKGVAVLGLTALLALALRRASAAGRHLVWVWGMTALLLLPILSAALPGWHILPRWEVEAPAAVIPADEASAELPTWALAPGGTAAPTVVAADDSSAAAPAALLAEPLPAQTSAEVSLEVTWHGWVLLAWSAGTILLLGQIVLGWASLAWLEQRSRSIQGGEWAKVLECACEELGLRRPVLLLESGRRSMPMTWGIWKTCVLLPTDAENWPAEQRRAVLLHELAHARRWDCATQLLAQLACALYWFNPLAWLAWRRIQSEREQACDDLVLRTGTKASAYAEQLLRIASEMPAARWSAAAIAMARPSKLEGRLLAILDASRNRKALTRLAAASLAIVLIAVVLPVAMLRGGETSQSPSQASTLRATQVDDSHAVFTGALPPQQRLVLRVGSTDMCIVDGSDQELTATFELSDRIAMEDGTLGRGFLFSVVRGDAQTGMARNQFYVAQSKNGPVPEGPIAIRSAQSIQDREGALIFAEIRSGANGLVPLSIRIEPARKQPTTDSTDSADNTKASSEKSVQSVVQQSSMKGDRELLLQVADGFENNLKKLHTWQGEATVVSENQYGKNPWIKSEVSFACDRDIDATRWELRRLILEGRPDPLTQIGMVKDKRLYVCPAWPPGQRPQSIMVVGQDLNPAAFANPGSDDVFHPMARIQQLGGDTPKTLRWYHQNADDPQLIGGTVRRDGDLITLEIGDATVTNRHVFDAGQGYNEVVRWMKDSSRETKIESSYEVVNGVYVPSKVTYTWSNPPETVHVTFAHHRVNEAMGPSEFTWQKMGLRNGDVVQDGEITSVIGRPQDESAALPTTRASRTRLEAYAERIRQVLPSGWSVTVEENRLQVLRQQAVRGRWFAPGMPSEAPIASEPFQMTLTFGPRMSESEYQRQADENAAVLKQWEIERSKQPSRKPLSPRQKHNLPLSYEGPFSIWVECPMLAPESFGFESRLVEEECRSAYAAVTGLFSAHSTSATHPTTSLSNDEKRALAAGLVLKIRQDAAWFDSVKSLHLKAEGSWQRGEKPARADRLEMAFDPKRLLFRWEHPQGSVTLDHRVCDGTEVRMRMMVQDGKEAFSAAGLSEAGVLVGRYLHSHFFWLQMAQHDLWFLPEEFAPTEASLGRPEEFELAGRERIDGRDCYVVERWAGGRTQRLYVGAVDGRLYASESRTYPQNPTAEVRRAMEAAVVEVAAHFDASVTNMEEYNRWRLGLSKERLGELQEQMRKRLRGFEVTELRKVFGDYREVQAGCWMPMELKQISGDEQSSRHELRVTSVRIDEELDDSLFELVLPAEANP